MKMNEELNILVIGSGKIASPHLDVLAALENINIKAICNKSGTGLEEIAKKYSIEKFSNNWENIIKNENIDAVWILVSHFATYGITKKCLEMRIPCFIEKPAGMSLGETLELSSIAKKNNVINQVALNRRFYSIINQAIAEVELRGPLMGIEICAPEPIKRKRNEARLDSKIYDNWLTANSIHFIDLFLFLGGDIESLAISKSTFQEPLVDNFHVSAKFKNGCLGSYIAHWLSPGRPTMSLYGNGIKVEFNSFAEAIVILEHNKTKKILKNKKDELFKEGFYYQAKIFINRIRNKESNSYPSATLEDVVRCMQLIESIYEA